MSTIIWIKTSDLPKLPISVIDKVELNNNWLYKLSDGRIVLEDEYDFKYLLDEMGNIITTYDGETKGYPLVCFVDTGFTI